MDRRAFAYLVPYWRRLVLVLVISFVSTAATLAMPYLSKVLIDQALIGRDTAALRRIVLGFAALGVFGFALNVVSGLRYTRVSAEILFDMRLSMYAHLQRLSPRFYARTRFGDIVSRLNNDISEIQRVAAETALAWVGNVLFLAGSLVMMIWLDWRLSLVALAPMPISFIALSIYRRRLEGRIGFRWCATRLGGSCQINRWRFATRRFWWQAGIHGLDYRRQSCAPWYIQRQPIVYGCSASCFARHLHTRNDADHHCSQLNAC